MTVAIKFEKVSRHFEAVKAVDGVSLEIVDGEFFSMLGPSGSGKTTCLRLIAGFEQPTAGRISIHGKDVAGKTAQFEISLRKVEHGRLPELDAEFAKSLGVADGDLGKMRAEIKANVEREVKQRLGARLKASVMQALLDTTKIELPKSLVDMEANRLVENARADLQGRGIKMENLPIDPRVFEEQARRRVALGLVMGECIKRHDLGAKPAQVRALVEEHAQSYEQPGEVVKWFYMQPQRLSEMEGLALESNVVNWVLSKAKAAEKTVSFEELMGSGA